MGLDEGRVGEESEQGASVRESEEPVPDGCGLTGGVGFVLREPELEERTGGSEEEKGQADGSGEGPEDGEDGVGRGVVPDGRRMPKESAMRATVMTKMCVCRWRAGLRGG